MSVSCVLFLSRWFGFVSQCNIFSCCLPCCFSPCPEIGPEIKEAISNYPIHCLIEGFLKEEQLKERFLPTMMMDEPAGYTYEDPHDQNQAIPTDGLPLRAAATNLHSFDFMEDNLRMPTFSFDDLSHPANNLQISVPLVDCNALHLHHHLGGVFHLEQEVLQTHLIQSSQPVDQQNTSWADRTMQQQHLNQQHYYTADEQQYHHVHVPTQCYDSVAAAAIPFPDPLSAATAPDLLNLLHLTRCNTIAPTTSAYPFDSFGGEFPSDNGGFYDPASMHMGYGSGPLQPQTTSHLLRDLLQSLPQSYGLFSGGMDQEKEATVGWHGGHGLSMFVGEEEEEGMGMGVFEYRKGVKGTFPTEKHRRLQMNQNFSDLRALIPNPTKADRASVVLDAIEYIHELQRTVAELKLLIDKKRFGRAKRMKTEYPADADPATAADVESSSMRPLGDADHRSDHLFNGPLRSSWLQRRSRETFVDVRIVDDEVNVKLTQKKKANCLLLASKALDELQLEAIHISGGFIGEHCIFMFNTKICEGTSVYASAIAKKLLEAMERTYPPYPSGF